MPAPMKEAGEETRWAGAVRGKGKGRTNKAVLAATKSKATPTGGTRFGETEDERDVETRVSRNQRFSFGEPLGEKGEKAIAFPPCRDNRQRRGPPANATVVNPDQAEACARDDTLSDIATGGVPLVASESMDTLPEEPVEHGPPVKVPAEEDMRISTEDEDRLNACLDGKD